MLAQKSYSSHVYFSIVALLLLTGWSQPQAYNAAQTGDPAHQSRAAYTSTTLFPGQTGHTLIQSLQTSYTPNQVYSYDTARDTLFARIRLEAGDSLRCVYTGRALQLDLTQDPTTYAFTSALRISTEHSWPQSKGASEGTMGHSDMHHLYPVLQEANSSRSNYPFAEIADGDAEAWYGPSGTLSSAPTSQATAYSKKDNAGSASTFEPRDDHKGDVARALFYFAAIHQAHADWSWFQSQWTTLLAWHEADPVSDLEQTRSQTIAAHQGNVNPFIEDPTLASRAFDGYTPPTASPRPAVAWINELHYDNTGADQDEGIEIAGTAGGSLAGYTLYFYRSDGTVYGQDALSGILPDQQNGCGTLWFSQASIQNGPADGVALVDPDGTVLEFISVEGTLTATDGPATGLTSTDLFIAQGNSTPVGHSLQLVGSGTTRESFSWSGPATQSPGTPNASQSFTSSLPVELVHFRALLHEGSVQLHWQTASESNNAGFAIEHAPASQPTAFTQDGFIAGQGTTVQTQTYTYTLRNLTPGSYHVRLKQIDFDGTITYSPTITLDIPVPLLEASSFAVLNAPYPNPATTTSTLEITLLTAASYEITLFNLLGQRIGSPFTGRREAGTYTHHLDVGTWPPGTYLVRLNAEGHVQTRKLMVIR